MPVATTATFGFGWPFNTHNYTYGGCCSLFSFILLLKDKVDSLQPQVLVEIVYKGVVESGRYRL